VVEAAGSSPVTQIRKGDSQGSPFCFSALFFTGMSLFVILFQRIACAFSITRRFVSLSVFLPERPDAAFFNGISEKKLPCYCTDIILYAIIQPLQQYISGGFIMLTKENITAVKGRGFLQNRGTECFSGRIVPVAGAFSADALETIAQCAREYGNGNVIFTSRLCAEVPGIPYDSIPAAEAFLEARGLHFGGTGAKVRPVTSCKGTTCVYGNIDTQALARKIHEKFYIGYRDVKLPHKFKIGVGGCPNSCMKPSLNDVGIEGNKEFVFDSEKCRGCGKCGVLDACPVKAVSKDGKITINENKCIHCGMCVGKCPFGAVPREADAVCTIYAGGTWGKYQRIGTPLSRRVPEAEVTEYIERIFLWYKENGYVKERLGAAIDRIGLDAFEKAVFDGDLSARKEEILAAPLKERE